MRDIDVRLAVRSRLVAEHEGDADTRIVEEMGIWHGSVRIDMAVINGSLSGYELKSERDTLDRLPVQAGLYSRVFDQLHLVAASKHMRHAEAEVPDWWGLIIAHGERDGVQLELYRQPQQNPAVEAIQIARLLWKEEALELLEAADAARGVRGASREKVALRLTEAFALPELSAKVRRCLKDRQAWLGKPVCHQ